MVQTKDEWLSHLKFAGLKLPRDPDSDAAVSIRKASSLKLCHFNFQYDLPAQVTENSSPAIEPPNPRSSSASPYTCVQQSLPAASGLKPYERIAAEKPGEELAPDAAIWEMYVEEAKEQDNELVSGKNGNLDQMLLFAALFSAILTAFIIESKDLLQQDSAEVTVTLLLAIAQSQQRVEQGTPQTLPPIELPPFSTPMSARWINGLWYTALGLSLSSALALKSPARSAFVALDAIWRNECPELHPNSYAILTSADLRVIEAVALTQYSKQDPPTIYHTTQHTNNTTEPLPEHSAIGIGHFLDPQPVASMQPTREGAGGTEKIPLTELRARYSRTLFRAAFCLSFHNSGRAPINRYPLKHLLDSLCLVAQCVDLNPTTCLSTHHPQTEDLNVFPNFYGYVIGTGLRYFLLPLELGDEDGLLAGFVGVLSAADVEAAPQLEYAAGRALAVVGPMLLRQWLQTEDNGLKKFLQEQPRILKCVDSVLTEWPATLKEDRLNGLADWTLRQLLAVTTVAVSLASSPYGSKLPQLAASALNRRANMASGRNGIYVAAGSMNLTIVSLILTVRENHQHLSQATRGSLLQLFQIKSWTSRSIFRDRAVPWTSLPHFLRCLYNWPDHGSEVQIILTELRELLQEDLDNAESSFSYVDSFACLSEGFASLASLSQLPDYTAITVECMKSVVHFAMADVRANSLVRGAFTWVVPGLLDCVSVVLKINTAHDAKNLVPVLAFIRDVVDLIDTVDAEGSIVVANHPVMNDIEAVLAEPHESFEGFADMVTVFEGIRARAGLCGWLMAMQNRLFDGAEP
ncbi:hypothetical protein FRC07_002455, partial [Ceratobasidium sp. 392]